MPFALKKNGAEYSFDNNGLVNTAGQPIGKWSVTEDNNIRVAPTAGGAALDFPVGWSFIDNQLWLVVEGAKQHNFHSQQMPDYRIVANKLEVRPSVTEVPAFTFTLTCEYSLNDDLDLKIKIGSIETTLSGVLEDTRSQFIFRFTDAALGTDDSLVLTGEWQRDTAVDGDLRMSFVYKVGGVARTMAIPRSFDVNPFTNSLRLRYEKQGKARFLELAGEMQFKGGTQIVFSIQRSGANGNTTLALNFQLSGTGKTVKQIDITILKENLKDGGKTLTIGGTLSAALGKNGLTLKFAYAKVSGGKQSASVNLAVSGTFKMKNGELVFKYQHNADGEEYTIGIRDFALGDAIVKGDLTVSDNGKTKSVRMAIGVTW